MKDHEGSHREVSGERAMRGCRACLLVPDALLPSDALLTSIVIQPSSADSVRANRALFVLRIFRVRTRLCAYISLIIFLPRHTPSYMPSPVTAFVAAMCHLIVCGKRVRRISSAILDTDAARGRSCAQTRMQICLVVSVFDQREER